MSVDVYMHDVDYNDVSVKKIFFQLRLVIYRFGKVFFFYSNIDSDLNFYCVRKRTLARQKLFACRLFSITDRTLEFTPINRSVCVVYYHRPTLLCTPAIDIHGLTPWIEKKNNCIFLRFFDALRA